MKAVFFNHQQQQCGVYQMGRRIGRTLGEAGVVTYLEVADAATARSLMESMRPHAAIYNWHPATIPWAPELVKRYTDCKHIGLMHEISPENTAAGAETFPYRMVSDPSFRADGVRLFRSIRQIPRHEPVASSNDIVTIGSFGFAVGGKLFSLIVQAVAQEFAQARVRLRIPSAHYGDGGGVLAQQAAAAARSVAGADIRVEIEHEFLDEAALISWLSANDLNVFFYDHNPGRGISSVIDYAIAARRPIAINDCQMFRHVKDRLGTYPTTSLRDALTNAPIVEDLYQQWSPERMVEEYRHMLATIGAPV